MELVIEIIHTRNFLSYEDCFALHMATKPLHACTSVSFNINSISAIDPMQIVLFFFFLNMSRSNNKTAFVLLAISRCNCARKTTAVKT